MDQYRDLNREMVREVQAMRMNMRLYCDEIVNLKAELMQKHETEINLRKILYKLIVENCLQLTEIVKPDADIIPLLKQSVEDFSICTVQRDSRKRQINTRRSNQLSAELRRSTSIINIRNSIRSISPLRRRTSGVMDDENYQTDQNTENEESAEMNDSEKGAEHESRGQVENESEKHQDENMVTEEQPSTCNVIYEESEEDRTANEMTEEESSQEVVDLDTDENDEHESVAEVLADVPCTRETLKDVTNILSKTMDLTCNNTKQKSERNYKKRQKKNNDRNLDKTADINASSTMNISSVKERSLRTSRRRNSKTTTAKSADCSANEEETLQEPRRNSRTRELRNTNRSIPISTQTCNTSGEEATIASFNFCEATSSTPNSRRKSLSPNSIGVKESMTLSTSTRPVRKCRPKVLSEPKLNNKLRNETSEILGKRKK